VTDRPIDLLRSLADAATRELFIASHIVLDESVSTILRRARERGVSVRLLTEVADRDGNGLRIKTTGLDGQYDAEDFARHDATIRQLARQGVQIRSGPIFSHVKLWVADRRLAATGSVNLTPNSLGTGAHPSLELMQSFEGDVGAALSAVARWLWAGATLHCHYDDQAGFRIHEAHGKDSPPPTHPAVVVGVPGHGYPILDVFNDAIAKASRSVRLVTMSAYRWNDLPGFEQAIASALDRGVTVTLARRTPDARTAECPSIAEMLRCGLRVIDVPGLHAKGIVIDDAWTALFTGNLNPFSLAGSTPTDHVELGVVDATGSGHLAQARHRLFSVAES
jgi:phosphatidylserine/phosphatidylglycerophosphate/cardiolipin synthase-like enzyme